VLNSSEMLLSSVARECSISAASSSAISGSDTISETAFEELHSTCVLECFGADPRSLASFARPNQLANSLHWLNRTTLGIGLTSLFSDWSHEIATTILPAFLASLGAGPGWLGAIEGRRTVFRVFPNSQQDTTPIA